MKAFIIAPVAILLSTPSVAADLVYQEPVAPEAVAVEAFTWSGPYVGIEGGAGWLKGDFSAGGASASQNFNGGTLGGFAGYNYQFDNNVVLGVEGDISYNWNEESFGAVDAGTDLGGSVRARLGYAMDNALVYGTAGWAITRGYVDVPGAGEDRETFNGYTVGAGVDYAFTQKVFGRAEYRFSDYGDKTISGFDTDLKEHRVMIGIGVKF